MPYVEGHVLDIVHVHEGEQLHYLVDVGSFGIQKVLVEAYENIEQVVEGESEDIIVPQNQKGVRPATLAFVVDEHSDDIPNVSKWITSTSFDN